MEKSSKTTPVKERQPEQSADSKVANVVTNSDSSEVKPEFRAPGGSSVSSSRSLGKKKRYKLWPWLLLLPIWTYVAFLIAQAVVLALTWGLGQVGIVLDGVNPALLVTVLTSIIYALSFLIVVLVPYRVFKRRTRLVELGLSDFPRWLDILLAILSLIVYIIASALVVALLTNSLSLELESNQQLPFDQGMLYSSYQYWLAFITLVVVVPFAEELLFRGYLYGKLRKTAPIWIAILATSLTFSLAHLWAPGSPLQIMVAIDTFVLSIFLCLLREYTGAIWAAFLVHAMKNGLAFYVLFVNPTMFNDIQASVMSLF